MTAAPLCLTLPDPDATAALAMRIGATLSAGDCLLLQGPIGAGKTHFARSLIQSQQDRPEDVPSPTFTLVQTYDTRRGEIWHADLYRLSSAGEIEELGLTEAFDTAICLVEWPDRLGDLSPAGALHITFATDAGDPSWRGVTLAAEDARWSDRLALLEGTV
ncbi:tRNA threonylcarbamoyladenosine biosynthesis protein TsaE [Cribrihabitans marinus]|uniref:tRNA threonylcarbamoyladenosine biosynthesis protein TsaE n=1 Tax=Cribrihabitans marinus TaxID=1227549 RepID=A0A1H6YPV9_9RHOB|nr:tRNA (adenosine(37)-N6)-threonylcarbamoyltransferase complex ATPase subunit type 1 TsaE [Cribrihabitans marinus]GGH29289.1 hypothetical protein GCM10010973_18710 [Cribrihabitans marinus]SEJ40967.1 tRNA threonylcarbamoyladenosine biosynthesis protein TsaE [Cribrihabitans marinus]